MNSASLGGSGSPSRKRRRERRAAARAAVEEVSTEKVTGAETDVEEVVAEKVAAEGAPAEKCEALKADTEKCAFEKTAAEISVAKKGAAEKCAALNADDEKCDAMKAAEKCAVEKAAAKKCAAIKAATGNFAAKASIEETEKSAAESAVTPVNAPDVASTSCLGKQPTPGETCWTCEGYLAPDHQCDGPHEHMSGADTVFPPVPPCQTEVAVVISPCPSLTSDHQCGLPPKPEVEGSKVQSPHLPLCHYCCHLGSGANPVHYSLQCLCPGKVCTCQCYCSVEQLEHRKLFYPEGFSGASMLPVSPKDRLKAKSLAEKRIGQWPIWPCTSEHCVKPVSR